MTYEELIKGQEEIKRQISSLHEESSALDTRYIDERKPKWFRKNMRLTVRLRVTKKHNDRLVGKLKAMKRYQPGYEYSVTGYCTGFCIGDNGELRPHLIRDDYSWLDEILGIEKAKWQPEGSCTKCKCYHKGYCYMAGGKEFGVQCATHKVKRSDRVCYYYEEKTVLYKDGHEYPNVTVIRDEKQTKYRIHNLNWSYYTEYTEDVIKANYTFEPKDKEKSVNNEE